MYISILEQQKKFDAAFEVISGDLGSLILREEDKLRMKVLSFTHIFFVIIFNFLVQIISSILWHGMCKQGFAFHISMDQHMLHMFRKK
jgi:hypothetical protein